MNRLAKEKSAYLQHAAHQKIDWYPWSDEAFEKAKNEDKPVFLSSGAIWCHWCHVMAQESFSDEEVARLLNENFITIKLDRDERPDIDRRYQQAVAALGFSGGWPLSVFLTPDKKPFYGGTYFPLVEGYGRPGFKTILKAISELYTKKKEEVDSNSQKLLDILKPKPITPGTMDTSLIDEGARAFLSEIDPVYGGFGKAPKFAMSGAIEFLINRYFFKKDEALGGALKKTLTTMAKGGFHDQLAGGFHRYSTDQAWTVPHFEKLADDNAWLLRNYVDAYAVFKDEFYKDVAEGIINFTRNELSHPEGGFYASQDADVTPDDEGGYFTWSDKDFRAVLTEEEYGVLSACLLNKWGTVHHDALKMVLYVSMGIDELARKFGMDQETVTDIVHRGKAKLLKEREKREKPFIDTMLYTSLNGMLISAYLKAFTILKNEEIKRFALKSLEKIMKINIHNGVLFHSEGVKAVIDDHVHLIDALIAAYEVTGDMLYLDRADRLMGLCVEKFWDSEEGGFFDTDEEVLGMRLKGIEDTPHPSANSLGVILFIKLSFICGKEEYRHYAEKALKLFSPLAQLMGYHAGHYLCALDAYFNTLELTLHASRESELALEALSYFRPYKSIVYKEDNGYVVPCFQGVCHAPVDGPENLKAFLARLT